MRSGRGEERRGGGRRKEGRGGGEIIGNAIDYERFHIPSLLYPYFLTLYVLRRCLEIIFEL